MPKIQVNETTVVHVSEGNSKLGKVPNLSMTPGESCGYPVCYSDGCYALRPYRMYPVVREAWNENLEAYRRDPVGFFEGVAMWMGQQTDRVKSPLANQEPLFRIHVGGDFVDQENLDRWLGIAVRFPIIKFMAFTKKYELLPPLSSLPVNIKVFTSIWPGIELPTGLAQTYPKAWLMEDPRLPEGKKYFCPGGCTDCGWNCWYEDQDTVFPKH